MRVATITTILKQEISVPEGAERIDVLEFLAEHQSFKDAFQGVSDLHQTFRILDVTVVEEHIDEIGEEAYDD